MIYKENIDQIDTYKSFFYPPLTNGRDLVIPYFNVGVSDHDLNKDINLKFINFCYIVLIHPIQVTLSEVIDEINKKEMEMDDNRYTVFLGGINIVSGEYEETGYKTSEIFLQTDDEFSELRRDRWELDEKAFARFSNIENLPKNLYEIVNPPPSSQ